MRVGGKLLDPSVGNAERRYCWDTEGHRDGESRRQHEWGKGDRKTRFPKTSGRVS